MKITLKGNPMSTQHSYGQHGRVRYMKKEAKELKNSYILQAKMQYKGPVLENHLSITIRLYFKDKRVRDWDNWHKLSMDSLTGVIYKDDNQIKSVTIHIMEADKGNPRIEIDIYDTQAKK